MDIINTIAPLPIEDLKKYFENTDTKYLIDYEKSKITGTKLLTYLSNLDIPCDIQIDDKSDLYYKLLRDYFNCPLLVNIECLELAAIEIILSKKKINTNERLDQFILENYEIVSKWERILDSCTLFNLYCIKDDTFKEFVKLHKKADDENLEGINFVNLLKYEHLYNYLDHVIPDNLYFYEKYFNEYLFKGKNLYQYWATDNNPLFLLTYSIAEGNFSNDEYICAKREEEIPT